MCCVKAFNLTKEAAIFNFLNLINKVTIWLCAMMTLLLSCYKKKGSYTIKAHPKQCLFALFGGVLAVSSLSLSANTQVLTQKTGEVRNKRQVLDSKVPKHNPKESSKENSHQKLHSVLVSIKPLQLMALALVKDTPIIIERLLPPEVSAHHYSLKPSDRQALQQAQRIIWVGPQFETFLVKVMAASKDKHLALLPGSFENTLNHHDHDHDHDRDPHIWLGSHALKKSLVEMQKFLAAAFPSYQVLFKRNLATMLVALNQQIDESHQVFNQVKDPSKRLGFVAFHPAYDLWVHDFGLNQLAVMNVHPGQSPGAKHLAKLHRLIKDKRVTCVLIEPQFDSSRVRALVRDQAVPIMEIDPLAGDIAIHSNGLLQYYQQLTQVFSKCLQGHGDKH